MTDQTTPGNTLPNPWPRILRDVTDLALLGLCVATAMAWLGRFWWVADLLSHFAVYYAVLSVVVLAVALVMRRKRVVWLALVVFVVNAWVIAPLFIPVSGAQASAGCSLKLAQVNVLHTNRDKARVLQWVRDSEADLVFVQELDPWWDRVIQEADIPYRFVVSSPEEGSFGIGMLVHDSVESDQAVTVESAEVIDLAGDVSRFVRHAIETTVLLDGKRIKVLSLHPPPPTTGELSALRDAVLRRAKDWADAQTDPHVIIGDLNTTPWSHAFAILTGDGQLISTLDGRGNQGTWPTHLPMPWLLPIDHCVHSRHWVCVGREIGPETGSDHLPLLVSLALVPAVRLAPDPPAVTRGPAAGTDLRPDEEPAGQPATIR